MVAAAKRVANIDRKSFFNADNLRMLVKVRLPGVLTRRDAVEAKLMPCFQHASSTDERAELIWNFRFDFEAGR